MIRRSKARGTSGAIHSELWSLTPQGKCGANLAVFLIFPPVNFSYWPNILCHTLVLLRRDSTRRLIDKRRLRKRGTMRHSMEE